jgi:hypothetical protein
MTGPEAEPLDVLRTMLALSDTFRSWVGATEGDEPTKLAAAKARIYLALEAAPLRPFALLGFGPAWSMTLASEADFTVGGSALLQLAKDVSPGEGESAADLFLAFARDAGVIVQELADLSAVGPYKRIRRISRSEPPGTASIEKDASKGAFAVVDYVIEWG